MIRYLSQNDIRMLIPSWDTLIDLIDTTLKIIVSKDFSQPIKLYLRYKNPNNRIIAMPAYVGGELDAVGVKWIASFPENIKNNLPRASAISILNHSDTGLPQALLSSNDLSGLRTAAVSGFVIKKLLQFIPQKKLTVGIIGFGPIGQLHAKMLLEILNNQIDQFYVYDLNRVNVNEHYPQLEFTNTWEEAYSKSDICLCCTTSAKRYINHEPKAGSVHLNVSLRDYFPHIVMQSSLIIVDDWEEVCREDTDIHTCARDHGLKKEDSISLADFATTNLEHLMQERDLYPFSKGCISFHPMGMAAFDIALSQYFYKQAVKNKVGTLLSQ